MRLDNSIQTAISNLLKNPILSILRDINFSSILKQSNFIKRDIGKSPYLVILHFLYMFVINKKISSFAKYSSDSYKKDVYYRLLKNSKYNWRKLLLLTSVKLICKLHKLQKTTDIKVLIIDDTVEIKRGKFIEGSCKNLWSNKEHRAIKGLNIVSLNYSDAYTDMMLDFSINYNKNQVVNVDENSFHHKSNAYKRRDEGNSGKNILALQMLKRVLKSGIYADYLLVDSWYAKPNFINEVKENGLDVIARVANNPKIWQFTGKFKTLETLYNYAKQNKASKLGNYNSIKYSYVSTTTTHKTIDRVKIVFIKTKDNLISIISTNINLSDIEIINTYKKRWNIEQGYKDLREYFQFGKEENRIFEALIARITLSFLAYNLTSYINRVQNEPQTLDNLFRDLECQLEALAISMELLRIGVMNSKNIPEQYKSVAFDSYSADLSEVAKKGFENIEDLNLSIDYKNGSFHDVGQSETYGVGKRDWIYELKASKTQTLGEAFKEYRKDIVYGENSQDIIKDALNLKEFSFKGIKSEADSLLEKYGSKDMELIKLLLMQKYLMGKDDSESDKEFYKLLKEWEESKNQE